MSLINRIKKARAKAEKLSEKSKKAKSKGKDKRAANLEKRSDKKSGKANKLERKPQQIAKQVTSFMMGNAFGTSNPMPAKKNLLQRKYKAPKLSEGLPLATPESGPKDTSYKKTPAPYHGNTKDTGGKPPKSLKKKNKK
jgi:seryl-tRNA synthetase